MNRKLSKEPCIRCDNYFKPTREYQKICENCQNEKDKSKESLKKKYFETREQLETISHNATLAKWKALSAGYKLGKKVWGSRFTRQRLSEDMGIPLTTVLRCLSLDRANQKSVKLMEDNKISASKLSMICSSKSKTFQDEMVKMVIEDNLTTYQIKSLKIKDVKDVGMEKLRLAVEKGFSRESSAIKSLENWIERGELILLLKKSKIEQHRLTDIKDKLKKLNKQIERYLDD